MKKETLIALRLGVTLWVIFASIFIPIIRSL